MLQKTKDEDWNLLPETVVNAMSLNSFKKII